MPSSSHAQAPELQGAPSPRLRLPDAHACPDAAAVLRLQPLPRIQPPAGRGGDGPHDPDPTIEDDEFAPNYNVGWPVLVVAPTSVLTNWEREFDMWGRFRCVWYRR